MKKTIIPVPDLETQDAIARTIVSAIRKRETVIKTANAAWTKALNDITASLCGTEPNGASDLTEYADDTKIYSLADVKKKIKELPPLTTDNTSQEDKHSLPFGATHARDPRQGLVRGHEPTSNPTGIRPRKSMSEGRKVWVKVRASQAERAEWRAKAAGAGLSLSDLVLDCKLSLAKLEKKRGNASTVRAEPMKRTATEGFNYV